MSADDTLQHEHPSAGSLADLPADELRRYAEELGLGVDREMPREKLVTLIRARQELLLDLEQSTLLDLVVWGRRPARPSASKESLAREIVHIQRTDYRALPQPALHALARLRELPATPQDDPEMLVRMLRKNDGLWRRLSRARRSIVGSLLTRLVEGKNQVPSDEYRFLPEDPSHESDRSKPTLKSQVVEHGIVGGIAQKLRGAADDYIAEKLDEIEKRIDAKLEQIDQRLAEWRDREVANRLKILRLTLIFSVLVALLSLGYNALKRRAEPQGSAPTAHQVSRD